ncbi:hypothetical protein GCM10027589_21530 [Actinocorallia lasiicapitis]
MTFDHRVLFRLFSSAAESFLGIRTPWSGYLEAGLLHQKLKQTGVTGERGGAEFSSSDLLAISVNDTPPNPADFSDDL